MADDLPRIIHSTVETHIREVEVDILNSRKLTALMEANGRIESGMGGNWVEWPIQYRRYKPKGYADGDTESFQPTDRLKTAKLGWRGYTIGDSMTKMQRLMNKGVNAIVDIWSRIVDDLMDDMREDFGDELLIDGYAADNYKRMCGIESFMGTNGATAATDSVAVPGAASAYAGLFTGLGKYGGEWEAGSTWPSGKGDAHYDFYTPIMVNWSSENWVDATHKTWADTCLSSLRRGILWSRKRKSKDGMVNMILLNEDLYFGFLEALSPKERILVNRGQGNGLVALGFEDVVNWDGVDVTSEYGLPANTGYGMNISHMGIWSLQDSLFVPEGPDYDIASKKWRFSVDMMGQAWFRPRFFVKWYNYA